MTKPKKFDVAPFLHVASTTFVVLLFIKLAEFSEGSVFVGIFYGFAIFDILISFMYVLNYSVISIVHLLFQSILFVIPICLFIFSNSFYFYPYEMNKVLDFYHFERIKGVNKLNLALWSTMALAVWNIRMIIAYVMMIDKTRILINRTTDGTSLGWEEFRNVLNSCAFVFLTTLSYFFDEPLHTCFTVLAIIEIVMAFSYILNSSFLMKVHYLYQSTMFSFIIALAVITVTHETMYRFETIEFLESYGSNGLVKFIHNRPIFAVFVLFSMWFLRLTHLAMSVIEMDTKARIKGNKKMMSDILNYGGTEKFTSVAN